MADRPFSPDALAERWGCSGELIRSMLRRGELAYFKIGKLYRIPANEVERIECQTITGSESTEADTSSTSRTTTGDVFAGRLVRMTKASPNPVLATSGRHSQPLRQTA
jgi:excisionase family DNA binding protein